MIAMELTKTYISCKRMCIIIKSATIGLYHMFCFSKFNKALSLSLFQVTLVFLQHAQIFRLLLKISVEENN